MSAGWRVLAGLILGVGLSELGLRLYFAPHEADRSYWGPGAFVADPELPYLHAPHASAVMGREGSFGPYEVYTNARGLRDLRQGPSHFGGARVVVIGASQGFGVGTERTEELVHARLEEGLRARADWPDDVEVFNLAQTGYHVPAMLTLFRRYRPFYRPQVVVVLLPGLVFASRGVADVVDGQRLPADRFAAGSALDRVRTRSFLWRRIVPNLRSGAEAELRKRLEDRKTRRARRAELIERYVGQLEQLVGELAADGVSVFCTLPPGSEALERLRRPGGCPVLVWPEDPQMYVAGDPHWSARGHALVAEKLARELPAWDALQGRTR